MRRMLGRVLLAAALILTSAAVTADGMTSAQTEKSVYRLVPGEFGIYTDGTHPEETTTGLNNALQWAHEQGYTTFIVPPGTYLIKKGVKGQPSPDARINMVPDMTFVLEEGAVLKKEPNDSERYELMYIGYGVNNVTIRGGKFVGDRDEHDYSSKDSPHSSGSHEGGIGIVTAGAHNLTIEGIEAYGFTGDAIAIGGHGQMVKDLYPAHFVSGTIGADGKPAADPTRIRTASPVALNHTLFQKEPYFELSNNINLPTEFDLYFYDAAGNLILGKTDVKVRQRIRIPDGAASIHLVFARATNTGSYIEIWWREPSRNVIIRDSELHYNRRQGITVGGADNVLIENNVIHDMRGTAPQSGIDVEGGFYENGFLNTNIQIRNNEFYNNAAYDVILYDGNNGVVEGNHLASRGAIGLAVSRPFTGALIKNNHFDGTRLLVYHDVAIVGNKMNDSYTFIEGPNVTIDGMKFTDAAFTVSSSRPFGVEVRNVTMVNTKRADSSFGIWVSPIRVTNLTIIGEARLAAINAGNAEGSEFTNLRMIGHSGGTLPRGTYNGCYFEGAEGNRRELSIANGGKYVFENCTFKAPIAPLGIYHPEADVTIRNSVVELTGDSHGINVGAAKSFVFENNTVKANQLTRPEVELVKINDYWQRNDPADVLRAVIQNNVIESNIAARGISTIYAGVGAPPYVVKNNTLYNAKLFLKENDEQSGNQELTK
jgi:hypothetical protein